MAVWYEARYTVKLVGGTTCPATSTDLSEDKANQIGERIKALIGTYLPATNVLFFPEVVGYVDCPAIESIVDFDGVYKVEGRLKTFL